MLLIGLHLSFTASAKTSPFIDKLTDKPATELSHGQYYLAQAKGGSAGLDRAVSKIRNRTGGRVLSAETKRRDGKDVHIIRILTKDGKVQRHKVDAETGRPLPRPGRRRR